MTTPSRVGAARTFVSRGIAALGVMVLATVISNGMNYLFSIVMGRVLGPVKFGELTALLGVLMILSVATQVVQTVVARHAAELASAGDEDALWGFAHKSTWRLFYVGVAAFVVWIPLSWPISDALNIDDPAAVLAAGTALILAFAVPVAWGALQGEQEFGALGLNMIVLSVGRFVIGVLLVAIGAGVAGAIGAISVASAICLALLWPRLHRGAHTATHAESGSIAPLVRYAVPTLIGLAAWTLLTNVDIVIVKGMATDLDAGYYGAAATIGKIALFLPIAFGLVIFPKGAAHHFAGTDSRYLIRRAGQVLLIVSVVFVLACWLFGSTAIQFMFGLAYLPAQDLLVPIAIAMCAFAIANMMLFYYLSVSRPAFGIMLLGVAVVQVVALALVASDPLAAAQVQAIIGLGILVVNEVFFVPILRPLRQ